MGSSLRRFSGTSINMYKLIIASLLAFATALPIEDTADVAAAKAEFNAAFQAAGGLAALQAAAPVHEIPAPAPLAAAPVVAAAGYPYAYAGYPYAGHAYAGLHGLAYG